MKLDYKMSKPQSGVVGNTNSVQWEQIPLEYTNTTCHKKHWQTQIRKSFFKIKKPHKMINAKKQKGNASTIDGQA